MANSRTTTNLNKPLAIRTKTLHNKIIIQEYNRCRDEGMKAIQYQQGRNKVLALFLE